MPDIGGGRPGTPSGPAASGSEIVTEAERFVGKVPYVYGGATPSGFDCSGLVQYVFAQFGVKLPRTSEEQAREGKSITAAELQPGDLIFSQWPGDNSAAPGHVAIYAGGGQLIEAPHTGEDVHKIAFDAGYKAHVTGYRRISGVTQPLPGPNNPLSGILQWPGEITKFFTDATTDMEKVFGLFAAFFRPSTYVRLGAGVLGAVFLIAGIFFLIRQEAHR